MKKTIILAVFLVLLTVFSSCRINDDPFLTETDTDTGTSTETVTETEAVTAEKREYVEVPPDDDFYSLTEEETVNKYSIPSLLHFNEEDYFDGTNYYFCNFAIFNPEKGIIDTQSLTLFYRNRSMFYDTKENKIVCKDPLCTHKTNSGCPLEGISFYNYLVHNGKIFFAKNVGNTSRASLMMYDFSTNKSVELLRDENIDNITLKRYNGTIIVEYHELTDDKDENAQFITKDVYRKLSDDGKLTELGWVNLADLETYTSSAHLLYKERYIAFARGTDTGNELKATIELMDLQTKESKVIFEKDILKDAEYKEFLNGYIPGQSMIMGGSIIDYIYDSKTLFSVTYIISKNSDNEKRPRAEDISEYYLIDLETNECKLLGKSKNSMPILHSSKCLIYAEPRINENDPLIIRVMDMINGTEKEYNLSELANETIPLNNYISGFKKGAVQFSYTAEPKEGEYHTTDYKSYELNLENGKVYKYGAPAA